MNLFDYYIDVTVPLEVLRHCIRPKSLHDLLPQWLGY